VLEKLGEPLRWADPRMIFVNSMSDLFHKRVPGAYIAKVASTMQLARWHTYQVLTKRAGRVKTLLSGSLREAAAEPHIW
jgi:protein gp37